jgi:G2/mitotic-specific cyclin 1/2
LSPLPFPSLPPILTRLQVHTRFHLLPETLFLSTHLIDRFLSLRAVAPGKLQLIGMACLLLSSKYEETVSPAIANFTQISDGAFSNAEMQQAEQHVLRTLGWDLSYPSPMHWLRRVSKAEGYVSVHLLFDDVLTRRARM